MLSLTSLAGWEDSVLASIRGATGSLLERDRQIERSGLYGEYPAIVRAYADLFRDPESALEALKRAVFLVWRAAMAAPGDTGIAALPDGVSRAVIEELDDTLRRGADDDELAWMLAWYQADGAHVFELFGATPRVLAVGVETPHDGWKAAHIDAAAMARRGQMGRYWSELAAGPG
jgi:hypothetical protein